MTEDMGNQKRNRTGVGMELTPQKYLVLNSAVMFWMLSPLLCFGQYTPGSIYYGTSNYIEYHAGNLPIIISVPHGGYLEPTSIPDRSCSSCTTVRDSRTEELAYEIDSAVQAVFGGHPHIIMNKLARLKLDANREIGEAALGNSEAETAWYEYHDFIQAAKDSCTLDFGSAIFIDLHGHGHPKQRLELGYLFNNATLQLTDSTLNAMNLQNSSSIRHLSNVLNPAVSFAEILRGNECMGELLASRGFPSVPSASDPAPLPTDPFWSGGYNTRRHGSRDSTDFNAIQFEANWTGLRNTTANREAFARAFACALRSYIDQWFVDLDSWDPGHIVSSTSDSGPGSLRSALLGAEDGTMITFDPSIHGDTIRLIQELQVCSEVTILGPGKDLLAVSGENTTRILRVMPGSDVEMSGISLVNGYTFSGQDGGAVLSHGQVKLVACVMKDNYAADDGGALAVADTTAAIYLDSCIVINNSCGDDGGALYCINGTLEIHTSTISNNFSASSGGGLYLNGMATISGSTFSGNEAISSGGAIRNLGDGALMCSNSTFGGNLAGNRGGAINTNGLIDLNFCTVVDNVASSLGGGLRVPSGGSCTIHNTLVANNQGSSGDDVSMFAGIFISQGHNFIGDTTGSSWLSGPGDQLGNTGAPLHPMILPLGANGGATETAALQAGSPCIDQADTAGVPLFDQRGQKRISGPFADIGAYEVCFSSTGIDAHVACESYTWIDGNTYLSDNNTAVFLLTNSAGCDSIVTLNLIINQLDTTTTQNGNVLIANLSNATYQWLDCNDSFAPLTGETNQSFSPSINGSFAVQIAQNDCMDTSACTVVNTVGIIENSFGQGFSVYPNPTSSNLTIELGDTYPSVDAQILNGRGQLVEKAVFLNPHTLSLTINGPPGFYYVEVVAEGQKKAVVSVVKK